MAGPLRSAFAALRQTLTRSPGPAPEPAPAPVEAPDLSGAPDHWLATVGERAPQLSTGGRIGGVIPPPRKAPEPDAEPSLSKPPAADEAEPSRGAVIEETEPLVESVARVPVPAPAVREVWARSGAAVGQRTPGQREVRRRSALVGSGGIEPEPGLGAERREAPVEPTPPSERRSAEPTPGSGHWPAEPAPVCERWPDEPAPVPARGRERAAVGAVGGRWPVLPDDTPQWTVVVRRDGRERDRYLDEEQRGLPWNA
ncbi:hypothetical protein GCM10022255_037820 [Dactylosporangium darangshiense]|uniref:Uncharacterized protein n=1 Tax=Dactylosporangium darangshiense TaxID=579108 RepID=A0ABP8D9I5_9ACTN